LAHVAQDRQSLPLDTNQLQVGAPDSAEEDAAHRFASTVDTSVGDPGRAVHAPIPIVADGLGHTVRRVPDPPPAPSGAPAAPTPAPAVSAADDVHIVVRDPDIDLGGGVLVPNLEGAKTRLMAKHNTGTWTLVLSIHASADRLGAQIPGHPSPSDQFYDQSAVDSLFNGDPAFVTWRNQFGPSRVTLYGCQVTARFEQAVANNLARGGTGQTATGLGAGCHPLSTSRTFGVKSQAEFAKLSPDDQQKVRSQVQAENQTWGYYGMAPVPDDQVLDYLFKGIGKGSWSSVEVQILNPKTQTYESQTPPIPYWNRASNHTFMMQCNPVPLSARPSSPGAPSFRQAPLTPGPPGN
jgi:hypothetical protein